MASSFYKRDISQAINKPFSSLSILSISLSSLSPVSSLRRLQHYLLEVQDYLENSCDPELESPAKRNTTD